MKRWSILMGGGVPTPAIDWRASSLVLPPWLTTARASTGTYFDSAGLLQTAAIDVARFSLTPFGMMLLREASRNNIARYNRDAQQTNWVKTSVSAVRDQVGIDGASNAASSLTATASNGTCLQSVTLASSTRTFAPYMKRLTGSGPVSLTQDGGTTWTDVASQLSTTEWRRPSVTQTVTNPNIGFRLSTSGDAIAFDYAGSEAGSDATTPIGPTTTASVTRAAETHTIGGSLLSILQGSAWTICVDAYLATLANAVGVVSGGVIGIDTSGNISTANGALNTLVGATIPAGSFFRVVVVNDPTGKGITVNGGPLVSDANPLTVSTATFLNAGNLFGGRLRAWPRRLSPSEARALSL